MIFPVREAAIEGGDCSTKAFLCPGEKGHFTVNLGVCITCLGVNSIEKITIIKGAQSFPEENSNKYIQEKDPNRMPAG